MHVTKMKKAKHTEQLGTPVLGTIFADVTDVRCFMKTETSEHALFGHFLRDSLGAGLG